VTDDDFRKFIINTYGEEGLQHLENLDLMERYKDLWKREIEHQQEMDDLWVQHQKHMRKMASRWQWVYLAMAVGLVAGTLIWLVLGEWWAAIPTLIGSVAYCFFYHQTGNEAVRSGGTPHPWQK
jgi:hypothetical protein